MPDKPVGPQWIEVRETLAIDAILRRGPRLVKQKAATIAKSRQATRLAALEKNVMKDRAAESLIEMAVLQGWDSLLTTFESPPEALDN